ncbi:MAG: hypothetical protein HYW86_04970 [Candidatus Roizmanbacteria bacterium]|nr:MAG: hypothetical protein HYW86_04970 [Candidatus Roizmanbacteria bacterium]
MSKPTISFKLSCPDGCIVIPTGTSLTKEEQWALAILYTAAARAKEGGLIPIGLSQFLTLSSEPGTPWTKVPNCQEKIAEAIFGLGQKRLLKIVEGAKDLYIVPLRTLAHLLKKCTLQPQPINV